MNTLKFSLLTLVFAIINLPALIAQVACDPAKCAEKHSSADRAQMETSLPVHFASNKEEPGKSAQFTFSKGKVIEVGMLSIKPGMEKALKENYFSKVIPIAKEYGLSNSQMFAITEKTYGDAPAKMVGFFTWDDLDQKRAFQRDPRFLALKNVRNAAIDFLTVGDYEVDETVTITFDDQTTYDFAALWIDQQEAPKLKEYFSKVGPLAMTPEYGFRSLVSLKPLGNHDGSYHPDAISLAAWGSPDAFARFRKEKVYKQNVHLREEATPYKDVFQLKAAL